mmetsp:Transcript_24165/g.49862  ORF Transcript_24165/g.49862 Transcript_24165/m.49862 type:complete len:287 (-) Transcript_24165:140-1000(-)
MKIFRHCSVTHAISPNHMCVDVSFLFGIGMCKRHWKEIHHPPPPPRPEDLPPPPQGQSVYDVIIPASVAWKVPKKGNTAGEIIASDVSGMATMAAMTEMPSDPLPLIAHLQGNLHLEAGWHRTQERLARGMRPAKSASAQFETWERQLVMFEIMLMAGIPYASHRDLAHAWGREKGFHNVLVSQVCDRRGEIARKKRSDSGRQMSQEQKAIFKEKLKRARANKKPKIAGEVLGGTGIRAVPVPVGVVPVHAPIPGIPGLNELPPASVEEMVQEQAEEAEMGDSAEV